MPHRRAGKPVLHHGSRTIHAEHLRPLRSGAVRKDITRRVEIADPVASQNQLRDSPLVLRGFLWSQAKLIKTRCLKLAKLRKP